MEIAKQKIGIDMRVKSKSNSHRRKRKVFFGNYKLFTALILFTLTFSIINIILIINFFSLFSNL